MTPATEAIALLIDLAQRGEINPWDVQVIEVIDRYLSTLPLNDPEARPGETDLSQPGQAFLWASMLVLLKANTLESIDEEEEIEVEEVTEDLDGSGNTRLPLHLEQHLRRRTAAPPPKRRPVTLSELIQQLQEMAAQLEETPAPSRTKSHHSILRSQAAKAIAHLAHDENLTEIAKRLEVFFSRHWQKLSVAKDWLNLDQLLEWWSVSTTESAIALGESPRKGTNSPAPDRVGVFWALLLLSAQSKVELSQEEFYQELKIRVLE
ncbi:MAG TPA: segregation/condensation protein A [Cyanobacteria bacterium UBA11149]|nr:segregation/condensation protein A [Cyanobacteria bacterium UBA11367]HBE56277.1 segregation/condensation protein A [Cyanobacteria bacterium UBA11366]HBK65057.1 segregation/condensation protein A [Cyanobacteria bacterium UBA11166]HBR75992.1 segregation/condensation protein A [Cyanobacteria bacterium UBA11159]HBS72617.1 segregation/condensation protein A [Cyanobacteria bacterium UBA11153]HBW88700.1 segregation/condensation protein A [Cyanobacteria bacterium UBA11149]HCA96773.1 segregation/co